MDYARFIRLRRPLWDAFEGELAADKGLRKAGYDRLEEMALRYRQVLHDHALAAARFPGTAAARRLQALALAGTRRLTGEGRRQPGVAAFFLRTFPAAFQRQRDLNLIALALFLLAVLWGLAMAVLRPELGLVFLGPDAVRGLEEGRLWTQSLVTTVPPSVSSSGIATNNITVALTSWGGGVLAGVVPLYIVLFNGLLLGAVAGVTLHYSMAGDLLRFIAAHGILELTLILVCSAAGLGLGRALVAAGDLPRPVALRAATSDALAVLLGCLPWFVVLALEGAFLALALHPVRPEPTDD